jgi:hypothetical protein
MNISPEDFIKEWTKEDGGLIKFPKMDIQALPIPEESREFLIKAGLPASAAPFLQFSVPSPHLEDHIGKRYFCLGYDGVGDPICIDKEENGEIRILLHEQKFSPGEFVNSSVPQLAMSLLAYRKFYKLNKGEVGEDAAFEDYADRGLLHQLRETLTKIDPMSVREGYFWKNESDIWSEIPE